MYIYAIYITKHVKISPALLEKQPQYTGQCGPNSSLIHSKRDAWLTVGFYKPSVHLQESLPFLIPTTNSSSSVYKTLRCASTQSAAGIPSSNMEQNRTRETAAELWSPLENICRRLEQHDCLHQYQNQCSYVYTIAFGTKSWVGEWTAFGRGCQMEPLFCVLVRISFIATAVPNISNEKQQKVL